MTVDAASRCKCGASFFAGRCGGSRSWRSQHAHEIGESLDVGENGGIRGTGSGGEIDGVLRSGVEETAGSFVALLREKLVGDAHLNVVSLAGEQEKGFVLSLPAKPRDGAVVAAAVHVAA